eukprot:363147-Chlamydomonas_euryale.AAC.4
MGVLHATSDTMMHGQTDVMSQNPSWQCCVPACCCTLLLLPQGDMQQVATPRHSGLSDTFVRQASLPALADMFWSLSPDQTVEQALLWLELPRFRVGHCSKLNAANNTNAAQHDDTSGSSQGLGRASPICSV